MAQGRPHMTGGYLSTVAVHAELRTRRQPGCSTSRPQLDAPLSVATLIEQEVTTASCRSCGRRRTIPGIACPPLVYGGCVMGLCRLLGPALAMLNGRGGVRGV